MTTLLGCTALALSAASAGAFVAPRTGLPSPSASTPVGGRNGRTLRMMAGKPMTLTEKILAKAAGREHVAPNDNIWVQVDNLMTHDVCGPGTFGLFKKEFGPTAKVCGSTRKGMAGASPVCVNKWIKKNRHDLTAWLIDPDPTPKTTHPYPQVWDRERVIIIPDHYIFTSDPRANRNVDILREFVQEQNIK